MKPHAWTLWVTMVLVGTAGAWLVSRGLAEETHEVQAKDDEVTKNDKIDKNDEEPLAPENVEKVGETITIVSKTFTPPGTMTFKEFPGTGTRVDIETDPGGLSPVREKDEPTEIKVSVAEVPETAGTWPLKGEGNLQPPPGGQGTPPHWSAKAYKIFPILYKDNTTWTEEARLTSDPVHLFTMDVIAGVEIQTAPGKTVEAKMWTGDDPEHKGTIYLQETGAGTGVYRNTGPGAAPYFYEEYQPAANRLKVVDEDKKWYVVPIVNMKEYPGLEVSEKVDAAEVAAVDGTPSLDAAEIYNDMTADPHNWNGVALYDVGHNKEQGTGAKCVELGAEVDLLNVSGHGLAAGGIRGESDYGLEADNFTPSDIGANWNNGEMEWLVLAACSQVEVSDPATDDDTGIKWIKAMPKVHALLGYYHTAPSGGVDVDIADDFCERLAPGGEYNDVIGAWMLANRPDLTTCPGKYATILVNMNNIYDDMYTLDAFPTEDDPGSSYRYYYIEEEEIWFEDNKFWLLHRDVTLP